MSVPRRKSSLFSAGPDRWLVLAGAGLLVLGLVMRLLTDIGRSTAQGDKTTPVADTQAPTPALPATTAETLAATPSAPVPAPPESRPAAAPPPEATTPAPKRDARPNATPPAKPAAPAALATNGWGVQLGAFGQRANAERLQTQVQRLGYTASVGASGTLTRVRVVGLPDRAAAQQAADSIGRALGTKGLVVGPGH